MPISRTELDRDRTLESNYANRKKSGFLWKHSACLMPDFCSGLASIREAAEPQGKKERHVLIHWVISYLRAK